LGKKGLQTRPYLADYFVLGLALGLYLLLATPNLHLPGLHHDEAQEAALAAMQLHDGLPSVAFRGVTWQVGGRALPVMVQDYIGSLNVYLAWGAFSLGGVSVESLRSMTLGLGLLTLGAAHQAGRAVAGRRVGALAVLLLAAHPTFIFWTRQGVLVTSYTLTLALVCLALVAVWRRRGGAWRLGLAAFCAGLGVWGKLLFLWFVIGGLGAWAVLGAADYWRRRTPPRWQAWTGRLALMGGCFLLGLAPLIDYNLRSGGTLSNVFNNFDQSYYGVDNQNVRANFVERLRQAPVVYESAHLREFGAQIANPYARPLLWLGGLACMGAGLIHRKRQGGRLFLGLLVALMVAQSSFTATALWFTHFALLLPFMALMVAGGLEGIGGMKRGARFGVAALCALLISHDALNTLRYHEALRASGGVATYSDAIYRLAAYLETYPRHTPVAALDWGIAPAVETLTRAHSVPNEVFGYTWEADAGFSARLAPFLARDDALYVLHVPAQTVFPRRDVFFATAEAAGRDLRLLSTVNDGRGQAYFEIWGSAP
jgi:hypothetical protein